MATLYFKVKADYEEVKRLNEEISKLKETLRDTNFSGSTGELIKQLDEATKKFDALVSSAAKTGATFKKIADNAKSIAEASRGIGGVQTSLSGASRGASDLSHSLRETHRTMQQLRASTDGVTMNLGNFIKNFTMASAAVTAFHKVTGTIKEAMGTIVSFEAANSTLRAIAGATEEELAALTEQALELGRKTIFTASQVTQLETELAKLGFRASEIIDMSEGVLFFAQSTGANLADAASTAGAALKMFGAQSDETMRYVSAMSAATRMSALNFQAISDNLATFGPMAHTMGMEIEDVLALFGKLKDAGIEGSTAMTSLRNIFTKVSQGKIEGMGPVSSLDDFVEGVKRAQEAIGGDVGKAMKMIGPRGGTQFMSLIQAINTNDAQTGKDSVTALRDRIKAESANMEGLTNMADTMSNNVAGARKMMESAWEGFILQFQGATGPVKQTIDLITAGITGITEAIKGENALGKFFDAAPVELLTTAITGAISTLAAYKVAMSTYSAVVSKAYSAQMESAAKAMADYSVATNTAIDADLKAAYAKGILTKEQVESIASTRAEVIAMRNKMIAENQLLAAKRETYMAYAKVSSAQTKQILLDKAEAVQKKINANNTLLDATANIADAKGKGINMGATLSLKGAMDALKGSMLTNPYFILIAALAALGYALYKCMNYVDAATQAQTRLNDIKQHHIELMRQEKSEAQSLATTIKDGNKSIDERYEAYKRLMDLLGGYDFNKDGERIGFKGMSFPEMNNLSSNELAATIERGVQHKREQDLNKRAKVYEELAETGDYHISKSELRTVLAKNGIVDPEEVQQYIDELTSIDYTTKDSAFYAEMLKGINGQLQDLGNNSRNVSVIEHLNEVLDSTNGDEAVKSLEDVSTQINDVEKNVSEAEKSLSGYQGSYEEKKAALNKEKGDLEKERVLIPVEYEQDKAGNVKMKDNENSKRYQQLTAEIKKREQALKKLQSLERKLKSFKFDLSGIDEKISQLASKREGADDKAKKEIDEKIESLKNTKAALEQTQKIINSGDISGAKTAVTQVKGYTEGRSMSKSNQSLVAKAYDAASASLEKYREKILAVINANKGTVGITNAVLKGMQDMKVSSTNLSKELAEPYKNAKKQLEKLEKDLEKAKKSGKLSLDKKLQMEAEIKGLKKAISDIDKIKEAAKECEKDPTKMKIIVDYVLGKPLEQVQAEAQADANRGKKKRELKDGDYFWGDNEELLKVKGRTKTGAIIPQKVAFKSSEGADMKRGADRLSQEEKTEDETKTESVVDAHRIATLKAQRDELIKKAKEEQEQFKKNLDRTASDKWISLLKNGDRKTREEAQANKEKGTESIEKQQKDRLNAILNQAKSIYDKEQEISSEQNATQDGKKKVKGKKIAWEQLSEIERAEYAIKTLGEDAGVKISTDESHNKVVSLTDELQDLYDKLISLTNEEYDIKIKGLDDTANRRMLEYTSKYGDTQKQVKQDDGRVETINQRKQAMQELLRLDQEEMIETGTSFPDYLFRTQEALDKIKNMDFEDFKRQLNWEEVFSNLENYTEEALRRIKSQLRDYLSIGDVDADNAKIISDRINDIDRQLNRSKDVWRNLFSNNSFVQKMGERADRKEKIREYRKTYDEQESLYKKYKSSAEEDQKKLKKHGYDGDSSRESLLKFADNAKENKQDIMSTITSLFGNQQGGASAFQNMGQMVNKIGGMGGNVQGMMGAGAGGAGAAGGGMGGMMGGAAGGAGGAIAMVDTIVHGINDNVQSLNKFLDKLEVNREEGFGYAMNEFARASQGATDAWESLKSGDVVGVVSGIWDSIDGIIAIFDRGNVAEMRRALARATESIENFTWALDRFVSDFEDVSFSDLLDTYQTAENYQKVVEGKEQQILADSAATWKHGSHGFGYKFAHFGKYGYDDIFGEMMDKGYLERVQKGMSTIGGNFRPMSDEEIAEYEKRWRGMTRAGQDEHPSNIHYDTSQGAQDKWLSSLTAEDWERMRKEDPELYSKIQYNLQQFGKDNEGLKEFSDAAIEAMDNLSEIPKEVEKIEDAFNEALLGFSFDSMKDGFVSALEDMTSDSETFASNFEEMMRKALVSSLSDKYNEQLKALYQRIADSAEQHSKNGTKMTLEEVESYRREYMDLSDSSRNEAQSLYEILGIDNDYQQGSASTREVNGITSDQADILNGRVSAIAMSVAQMQAGGEIQGLTLSSINTAMLSQLEYGKGSIMEIQGIREDMAKSYLELVDIRTNTQLSAEFLEVISEYMKGVKENTDRL